MRKVSIRGWIALPSPQWFDGATAIVGLDDVTLIDALSKRVAETVIEGISGQQDRIPFSLEAHGISGRATATCWRRKSGVRAQTALLPATS